MTKKLKSTIDGMPWTEAKIDEILTSLKAGGTISFAFGNDELKYLSVLDEEIFQKRDDILFHVLSAADNKILTKEELENLTKMNFVKKLKISGFKNKSLSELQNMNGIEELMLLPINKLDISFLHDYIKLKKLSLYGVDSVEVLKDNSSLEYLYLSTTVDSYEFARGLTNLKKVLVDNCISTSDLTPLNQSSLEYLGIHSIKKLDEIDSISSFSGLKELHLDASRIKTLPSFEKMISLRKMKLQFMKVWDNPHILKTIPNIEELELVDINTKIKAEDLFFLKEIKSLKVLDFRFIDFSKSRIEKLHKFFGENNPNIQVKV